MKGLLASVVATAIALIALAYLLPHYIAFKGGVVELAGLAVVVGIANGLVKPVVKLLTFPINLMTLGLVGIVINAVLLLGAAWVADTYLHAGFTIAGWPARGFTVDTAIGAVIGSAALGILTALVGLVVKD